MTNESAFASALASARSSGTPMARPVSEWLPSTVQDACRMQSRVVAHLGAIAAWKVSAISARGQIALGVDRPIAAPVPGQWTLDSPATLRLDRFLHPLLECEFAFEIGADLPARDAPYTRVEVEAAIAALRIAIEVCDSRLPSGSPVLAQLVDGFNNGALVLGPRHVDWRGVDYAHHRMTLRHDDGGGTGPRELATGDGRPILDGDPVGAVVLMANLQPQLYGGLRRGQVVTTGTCTGAVRVPGPGDFEADFGSLGSVRLRCELED